MDRVRKSQMKNLPISIALSTGKVSMINWWKLVKVIEAHTCTNWYQLFIVLHSSLYIAKLKMIFVYMYTFQTNVNTYICTVHMYKYYRYVCIYGH